MKKKLLLIDYENIQKIDLSFIHDMDIEVKIFVGQSQKNIPFDVVQSVQKFGNNVEWIKIDGAGNNALDFHIAFYIGRICSSDADVSLIILSKDKGFDPLIRFVNKLKFSCERINSILEITKERQLPELNSDHMRKILDNLTKITKNKRPRKRKTLQQHINALFQKKMSEQEIDKFIDSLFVQKQLSEQNNKLIYNF
jgi:hypothetical protein